VQKSRDRKIQFLRDKKGIRAVRPRGLGARAKTPRPTAQSNHPEQEEQILEMTRKYPAYSYVRVANQLQLEGKSIGANAVRGVWERHGLVKKLGRFLWIDHEAQAGRAILTEEIAKKVSRLKRLDEASDNHVEAKAPGELISQDLYFVGVIKGVGKIYLQSAVDCANSVGFGRLCLSKLPIHSAALMHEKILPFYDGLGVRVQSVLTDCGREYCGRQDQHVYELYLGAQGIEHRTTRPASPYTNGFVERFHRTLKDEFFAKTFREKWYSTLDELQADLDQFLKFYNEERAHSGYRCQGKTPMQTLKFQMENPKSKVSDESSEPMAA
jgi:hypothetical protein